jgi:glycosyltransferase involved in cell wall biosynthesis
MPNPLRILYAAGPGDVLGTFRHWQQSHDDPSQVAMTYSGQFYDFCRAHGHQAYVISAGQRPPSRARFGSFRIDNRPIPFENRGGLLYHLGQTWASLRLLCMALRFRADAAVVVSGSGHWFLLAPLPLLGVRVIASIHCVVWPKNRPLHGLSKLIGRLNGWFFASSSTTLLCASSDIQRQLEQIAGRPLPSTIAFLPTYRRGTFDAAAPPQNKPFRLLFAGRIERDKGVFDLLQIARDLAAQQRTDIEFDLCGDGTALPDLRRAIDQAGLASRFRCHGHCDRTTMRRMYADCSAVIVPTTGDFIEGFNQVVVEGVLAGRPVITSSICPALDYVRPAIVEVPPDNPSAYRHAILRLADDHPFYDQLARAGQDVQDPFYDPQCGWEAALRKALDPRRMRRNALL